MADEGNDSDFLSLLQEIEHADALDRFPNPPSMDLMDVFLSEGKTKDSIGDRTIQSRTRHVERCRMNRKRKKEELVELRTTATTLETTLATLTKDPTSLMSPWQTASQQLALESHKAISENKRLREALQRQWNAAQAIQQALDHVPIEAVGKSDNRSFKRERTATLPSTPTMNVYRELFEKLHSTYEENDNGAQLAQLPIGVRKISMEMISQSGSETEMSLQVIECQRLPFSLAHASDATWMHLSTPSICANQQTNTTCGQSALTSIGDDVFGECGSYCSPQSTPSVPPGRLAIRRYKDPHRLTFVWACDGCYHCDDAKTPIGRVTERGWCTVEPSDDGDTSTIFRILVQYVPHNDLDKKRWCASQPRLSSDMALRLYRATLARTFGAVEHEVFKEEPQCR